MCGIVGIFSPGHKVSENIVREMRDLLHHRGPDGSGLYFGSDIGLGHRRLKIIDLSTKGHQPMCNEDKTIWITYNGEIYNFIELKEELKQKGHVFSSETDTEVIIHAYEEYGTSCLNKLNGMFSFAIWDSNKDTLFCARDRFGEKPFYYFKDGEKLIFASEIKSILHYLDYVGYPRRVNDSRLSDYLTYGGIMDHTSETLFEGVLQLPPSHYISKNKNNMIIKKYYELDDCKLTKGNLDEKFRKHFENSIKLRLRSDVPLGALLSGGLDSTSIVSIVNNLRNKENSIGQKDFVTFTAGSLDPIYDESKYIKRLPKEISLNNETIFLDGKNMLQTLKKIIWHHDEPILGTSIFSHWHLMEKAKERGVTVLLHGQGADEFLYGYDYYFSYYLTDLLLDGQFAKFANLVKRLAQVNNTYQISIIRRAFQNFIPKEVNLKLATAFNDYQRFFKLRIPDKKDKLNKYQYPALKRRSYSDIFSTNMPYILHYEDRNSMAFSLESRAPFLDHNLASFIFSLPFDEKINGMITKVIFRKSMKGIIPEKIRQRKDKMGFTTPMDLWLTNSKKEIEILFKSSSFKSRGIFNSKKILDTFDKYCKGKNRSKYRNIIWKALCTELWFRLFFDKSETKNKLSPN